MSAAGSTVNFFVSSVSCRESTQHTLCQKPLSAETCRSFGPDQGLSIPKRRQVAALQGDAQFLLALVAHSYLSLQCDRFLIVWIDRDCAQRKLPRLASITTFKKYLA